MEMWNFNWGGHHFEIEVAIEGNPLYGTRTGVLRIDGKLVDQRTMWLPFPLYLVPKGPTLTAAIQGQGGKALSVRVDCTWIGGCRVFVDGSEVFKAPVW